MKISIITICYNTEKTIERTIKSVLSQTFQEIEYVLVDGGSKDGTIEIVKKYEPLFEGRMKWKSEPDTGIYNAMNKGIERCTGELIGIVNSDDWLEPEAVSHICALAENTVNFKDCIFCGSLMFHYSDGSMQLMEADEERFLKGMPKGSLNHGAYHPSMFVGRNVYNLIGVFDEKYRVKADFDFIERCYTGGVKFYFTKAVINNMSDGGASNRLNLKRRISDIKYSCEKKGYNSFRTHREIVKYILKLFMKSLIPDSWMKSYRKHSLK